MHRGTLHTLAPNSRPGLSGFAGRRRRLQRSVSCEQRRACRELRLNCAAGFSNSPTNGTDPTGLRRPPTPLPPLPPGAPIPPMPNGGWTGSRPPFAPPDGYSWWHNPQTGHWWLVPPTAVAANPQLSVWGPLWNSLYRSWRSIGEFYTGDWDAAYRDGPFGQSSGGYRTAVTWLLGGSTVAITAACGVGALEFFAYGNESILVEGLISGNPLGKGGLFQIRPPGRPPWFRIDFHRWGGGPRLPHIDAPPFGWHHWPWWW
jgi:hypothetical protein